MKFGCGKNCASVPDTEGRLCFGYGELDKLNYWEFPCAKCARAYDEKFKPIKQSWPLPQSKIDISEMEIKIPEHLKYIGTFGGAVTLRPISTNKPTRVVIWHTANKSFYISLEFGDVIEEAILA